MAMPKLDFDIVKDLEDAGASQELAKAVVRAISEKTVAQLATKSDLAELRTELIETRESLRGEIAEVRVELIEKMSDVQTKLIIWLVGTAIASVSLMAAIGQLLK